MYAVKLLKINKLLLLHLVGFLHYFIYIGMKFDPTIATGYSGQEAEAILNLLFEEEIWITPIWEVT